MYALYMYILRSLNIFFYRHEVNHVNLPHWENIKLKMHTQSGVTGIKLYYSINRDT